MVNDDLTREDILIAFTKSDGNVDCTAPDHDDGVWLVWGREILALLRTLEVYELFT